MTTNPLTKFIRFNKSRNLGPKDLNFIKYMDHKFEKIDCNQIEQLYHDYGTPCYEFIGNIIYSTSVYCSDLNIEFNYYEGMINGTKRNVFYIQLTGYLYFWKYILKNDEVKLNINFRMNIVSKEITAIYNTQKLRLSIKTLLSFEYVKKYIITFMTCLWKQNKRFLFII